MQAEEALAAIEQCLGLADDLCPVEQGQRTTVIVGTIQIHQALYPLLYRLERRGWLAGRWVEKAGERRRRFYRLTPAGRKVLGTQRETFREFVLAGKRVARLGHA